MRILARSYDLPGIDWSGAAELLRQEAAVVWELQKAGIILGIWFTRPGRDAVILLECSSAKVAGSVLADLPLVRERFIRFEVVELVAYDGFERLFAPALKPATTPRIRRPTHRTRSSARTAKP